MKALYSSLNHTHILVGFRPSIAISDLVRDIKSVSDYIKKQPEHHEKQTFREEYFHFLEQFEIEMDGLAAPLRGARGECVLNSPCAFAHGYQPLSAPRFFPTTFASEPGKRVLIFDKTSTRFRAKHNS
jgi:hypothetical protein